MTISHYQYWCETLADDLFILLEDKDRQYIYKNHAHYFQLALGENRVSTKKILAFLNKSLPQRKKAFDNLSQDDRYRYWILSRYLALKAAIVFQQAETFANLQGFPYKKAFQHGAQVLLQSNFELSPSHLLFDRLDNE